MMLIPKLVRRLVHEIITHDECRQSSDEGDWKAIEALRDAAQAKVLGCSRLAQNLF